MKIVYCQATFVLDFEQTKECIERVSPHVDVTVIAYDQSLTDEQIEWLHSMEATHNVIPIFYEWNDNMPEMRNAYLEKAKEIGADWVCVSDPDELYSEELASNLRILIESYDNQGFNLLAVHAVDQFENIEWLDELDLLKESPGGYRETDFWKPLLIFKLSPDVVYEGVGAQKNVHEMLGSTSKSIQWRPYSLPKKYHYVHRKSALRIWRNAARNMFIGGGGDNVGALNQLWVDLKRVLTPIGIITWPVFERFLRGDTDHEVSKDFLEWTLKALQTPPTNYGTETRETAKYFYIHRKDFVTEDVKTLLENPPVLTDDIELDNFITRAYFQVLGRHPDAPGKKFYKQALLDGRLERDQLVLALQQSPEYAQKAMGLAGRQEMVPIKVPINVQINVSEALYLDALMRSGIYWDIIKPKIDLGGDLLKWVSRKKTFYEWFYKNREDLKIQDLVDGILNFVPKPDSVALCIMGYSSVLPIIIESIEIIGRYVDEIHIQGDDWTDEDISRLEELRQDLNRGGSLVPEVKVHFEPWFDNFSDYKNKAISYADTEWVIIFDHDEIPTKELAEELREIIKKSERGKKHNIVTMDVIDIQTIDGEEASQHVSSGGKPLLHWHVQDPYYGNPHIWLKSNYYPWRMIKVPYAYRHVKEMGTELPRSVRNVFLGGGGDNTREGNPLWVELRAKTKELGVDTWAQFDEYLKKGLIDEELLDILILLSEAPWKDDELTHPLKYYLELHPEEKGRENVE